MNARMRRLASDWEQVKKDFAGHKHIVVIPVGEEPAEKYHITYYVNGLYLLPDGQVQVLARHEVDIILHSEYPRYKPICKILTPIWHPNFKNGDICIGDIWGAGETLSDIIVNIGNMIQYKSWNSFSPLNADAAQWAIENKHLFPVGNAELYAADYSDAAKSVEINLFDEESPAEDVSEPQVTLAEDGEQPTNEVTEGEETVQETADLSFTAVETVAAENDGNDFVITAEELEGIEFVPSAARMQSVNHATVKGKKLNFKTVLVKGLLWALIGAFLGFFFSEIATPIVGNAAVAKMLGYSDLARYYEYSEKATDLSNEIYAEYERYCKANGLDADDEGNLSNWFLYHAGEEAQERFSEYLEYDEKADDALYDAYVYDFDSDADDLESAIKNVSRTHTALWSGIIALFIGLFLGVGEGVFYGSAGKAAAYGGLGAGISLGIGSISGYIAQWMYAALLTDDASDFTKIIIRGIGWAFMGLGIGLAVGLIKPAGKRILFCSLGGLAGGFTGGALFNPICDIIPNDVVARGVAIVVMGLLIGLGVGLLEQVAKQAWLKVVRGEFEGKEYLVFSGVTSIGNNGKNTIVLFKDKLVGPHHCDIVLEGANYSIVDCGTPMGTVVNGRRIVRQTLRHGDSIAVGNSVLIFNTK